MDMPVLSTLPLVISASAERPFLLELLLDEADDRALGFRSNWTLLLLLALFELFVLSRDSVRCRGSIRANGRIEMAPGTHLRGDG